MPRKEFPELKTLSPRKGSTMTQFGQKHDSQHLRKPSAQFAPQASMPNFYNKKTHRHPSISLYLNSAKNHKKQRTLGALDHLSDSEFCGGDTLDETDVFCYLQSLSKEQPPPIESHEQEVELANEPPLPVTTQQSLPPPLEPKKPTKREEYRNFLAQLPPVLTKIEHQYDLDRLTPLFREHQQNMKLFEPQSATHKPKTMRELHEQERQ